MHPTSISNARAVRLGARVTFGLCLYYLGVKKNGVIDAPACISIPCSTSEDSLCVRSEDSAWWWLARYFVSLRWLVVAALATRRRPHRALLTAHRAHILNRDIRSRVTPRSRRPVIRRSRRVLTPRNPRRCPQRPQLVAQWRRRVRSRSPVRATRIAEPQSATCSFPNARSPV